MALYNVISTAPTMTQDGTAIQAGGIVNVVEWDGITPFNPGAGLTLKLRQPTDATKWTGAIPVAAAP
jgi:hypothetical protein